MWYPNNPFHVSPQLLPMLSQSATSLQAIMAASPSKSAAQSAAADDYDPEFIAESLSAVGKKKSTRVRRA
jgi:hypothetical protein